MASTPVVDITPPALTATMDYQITTSRPSRSRFRDFFGRRKASVSPVNADFRAAGQQDDRNHPTSITQQRHLSIPNKPSLSQRSHSETAVPRSASIEPRNRSRNRGSASGTPSPESRSFCQASSRSRLHSTAQIPGRAFLERLPSSPNLRPATSFNELSGSGSRCSSSHVPASPHNDFGPGFIAKGNNAFVDKVFVLTDGGAILQFKVDGAPDRQPEKVLQLGAESVVMPTDLIAGLYSVLEVSAGYASNNEHRVQTPRSSWTRNPFRSSSSKRPLESLLMAFESPDLMSTWMFAIRKEIESLGGTAHRPVSACHVAEKKKPALRNASTERFSLRQNFLHLSRSSSNLRTEVTETDPEVKELPRLPVPPTYQRTMSSRSCAASSITTNTSLDRLRESDANSTTTGATNSFDGSFVLDSPIKESFAHISSPVPTIESRTESIPERHTLFTVNSPTQTIHERRKSLASQRVQNQNSTTVASKESSNEALAPAIPESVKSPSKLNLPRPVVVLPPIPSPAEANRPSAIPRTQSAECVTNLPDTESIRPASSYEVHRSKPSTDYAGKSMYSLFPKKKVEQVKTEPLVVPEMNNIPGLSHTHATDHLELPPTPTVAITPLAHPLTARNISKKPMPLKLLAPFDIEQPERSPAVTDDMLASNFGTHMSKFPPSPVSPSQISVPSFDDLKFDFSFLKQDFNGVESRRSTTPSVESNTSYVKRQRSSPSIWSGRPPSAPLGPPPKGPLPAVPKDDGTSSKPPSPQSNSTSERRKSARSRANSQAPPSAFAKRQTSSQSQSSPSPSNRSSISTQENPTSGPSSPREAVGMPSIVSPPKVVDIVSLRPKSSHKSSTSSSFKLHKRAKSSTGHSESNYFKSFQSQSMLCAKPDSLFCLAGPGEKDDKDLFADF